MRVVYRHTYTVIVDGDANFNDEASLHTVTEGGARDARLNTILVKHGGIEPKPVRASVVTVTRFEVEA